MHTSSSRFALAPANLPAELNSIVGRERELDSVVTVCQDNRLVTLTGPGGIGKTRLAVAVATRMVSHQYRPFFVDLAPIGDAALVPTALAATLGIQVDAHENVMDRVHSVLAHHTVVLVMDNCEHLLPGVARLVAEVLTTNPDVTVVATSRQPLEVAGERLWPVDPLGVPPAGCSQAQTEESDSGALFIARLPSNTATRSLSAEDVAAVGAVCRRVEGIPLALELAAARSRTLSLPELADRLDRSLGELALPGHGVLPRHRTMHVALDWSYRLLTPAAQRALRAMSVFAGGCDLPAFAAVCIDDEDRDALEVVDELVRTSFVVIDRTGPDTRYRLLEPIRQFASEMLDANGDRDDRQHRHLHFYASLARTLNVEQDQPGGTVPVDRLSRDLGNWRVALDWAAGATDRVDVGLHLAADLYDHWTIGAHHAEGVARVVGLLRTGRGSADARSRAARIAAIIAAHMGDGDQSLVLSEQALREAKGGGADRAQERRARQILAQILLDRGDAVAARLHLAPALPIDGEQVSDVDAFCVITQGEIDFATGDLDRAAAGFQRVLTGDFGSLAWIGGAARGLLGEIMLERGDVTLARSWLAEAVALDEVLGDVISLIDTHLGLVFLECAAGRVDDAEAHLRAAIALRLDTNRPGDLRVLEARAALALHGSSPSEAARLTETALALANDLGSAGHRCLTLRLRGDAQLATDDPDGALSTFRELITAAGAIPAPCRVAEGHEGASAAAGVLGQTQAAHGHLAAAAEIRGLTGTRRLRRPGVEMHLAHLEAELGPGASSAGETTPRP